MARVQAFIRCNFCDTVLEGGIYGQCPMCGGNLALAHQVFMVGGVIVDSVQNNTGSYYLDGGITFGNGRVDAIGYYTTWGGLGPEDMDIAEGTPIGHRESYTPAPKRAAEEYVRGLAANNLWAAVQNLLKG